MHLFSCKGQRMKRPRREAAKLKVGMTLAACFAKIWTISKACLCLFGIHGQYKNKQLRTYLMILSSKGRGRIQTG